MTIFPFMAPKKLWAIIKRSFSDFFDDDVPKLSSSLAFSTIFSLPGLLIIIIIWISNIFLSRQIVEGTLYNQIAKLVGEKLAASIQETMQNSLLSGQSGVATTIGIIALVIGATAVFVEIQPSINHIWKLKAKPRKAKGWMRLIINRLLSFSLIISLGFILLVSLVVNGALDLLVNQLLNRFPEITVIVVYIINLLVSFLITALIFGAIFKVLPDAKVQWKHVRVGAFTTAALFMAGRFLISFYLGQSKMTTQQLMVRQAQPSLCCYGYIILL